MEKFTFYFREEIMRAITFATFMLSSLCVYGNLSAIPGQDTFTIKQDGNVTAYTNDADVVSYSGNKEDQEFLAALKKKYDGLNNEDKINEALKQQKYIEVLNYLWTEPSSKKRIAWLESQVKEGHPLLMFELGEEYYLQDPTIKTYATLTMPWLLAGARYTLIDSVCTSDKSVSAAAEMLLFLYQGRILNNVLSKYSQEDLEKYINENANEIQKSNIAILKKAIQPILSNDNVSSPSWVFSHGLNAFTGNQNTIPESQCKELRKKEAQMFIDKANEIEKKLK